MDYANSLVYGLNDDDLLGRLEKIQRADDLQGWKIWQHLREKGEASFGAALAPNNLYVLGADFPLPERDCSTVPITSRQPL